jgi:hypothetical protein
MKTQPLIAGIAALLLAAIAIAGITYALMDHPSNLYIDESDDPPVWQQP